MKLSEYIAEKGDEFCADRWGFKVRTVSSWKYGERYPRPEQARVIVEKENGELSMDDIYGSPPTRASA